MAFLVTDIKQTCLRQGLGVPSAVRKRLSKAYVHREGLRGHTLPGHLLVRKLNICNYLNKVLYTTALNNRVNLLSFPTLWFEL